MIEAAKKRAHVTSDTELLELALSRLALEDDFDARLVTVEIEMIVALALD